MLKGKASGLLEHNAKRFLLATRSDAQKWKYDEREHRDHNNGRERPSNQKSPPMMSVHDHENNPDEYDLIEASLLCEA